MRIISGKFKGRRISAPTNITARPTTDFAKEGLFNLLNNRIDFENIQVLDLFAGTGGIGIEFVSRGADNVTAIELNDRHCAFIRKICAELKIDSHTGRDVILGADLEHAIKEPGQQIHSVSDYSLVPSFREKIGDKLSVYR